MDPRTESIKQEVDQTLEDMAEKMEQIESRVYGAARETVQNVKEKFDVRHLTAEHPWTMLGASVAVGFLAGNIRRSESRRRRRLAAAAELEGGRRFSYEHSDDPYEQIADEGYGDGMAEMVHVSGYERGTGGYGEESSGYRQGMSGHGKEERHPSRELVRRSISRVSSRVKASAPGVLSSLKEHFGDEIEALKKAALITVGTSLSGLIHKNLPQFAEHFDRVRHDGGHEGEYGSGQQSQQRTQGWSQGQGESRQGSESRYGSGSQYGSEGRYGGGSQAGGEYQGQSERYGSQGQQGQGRAGGQGQGEGRYGSQGQQGQSRTGSQGQGETRYGSQGQQGQGRSGGQGQGEGRYGGQQARGYNPDSPNVGSSVDNEYGNRDNESGYGTSGHPSGRKSHN